MNLTEKRMLELTGQLDVLNETFNETDRRALIPPSERTSPTNLQVPQQQFLIPGPVKKWLDSLGRDDLQKLLRYLNSTVSAQSPESGDRESHF